MLLFHIKFAHAHEPGFTVQCNLQGCKRTFKNFSTFRNHVYCFHEGIELGAVSDTNLEDAAAPLSEDSDTSSSDQVSHQGNSVPIAECIVTEDTLQRAAALWILKTRDTHRIPQSVMDQMVSDLGNLFQCALAGISSKVSCIMKDNGVAEDVVKSVCSHLDRDGPFSDIFRGLKTHRQQFKYFQKNFDLVVSPFTPLPPPPPFLLPLPPCTTMGLSGWNLTGFYLLGWKFLYKLRSQWKKQEHKRLALIFEEGLRGGVKQFGKGEASPP